MPISPKLGARAARSAAAAATLAALLSGGVDLPAWAQQVSPPALDTPSANGVIQQLAAQLAAAGSRDQVVSLLVASRLSKAEVRAAVVQASALRGVQSSSSVTVSQRVITPNASEPVSVTLESLPGLLSKLRNEGDSQKLSAAEIYSSQISTFQKVIEERKILLAAAVKRGDEAEASVYRQLIANAEKSIAKALKSIEDIVSVQPDSDISTDIVLDNPTPPADEVADTLKTILGLIDENKAAPDSRMTFVDTRANRTSTAAITQPSGPSLAQGQTTTVYVA